MEQLEGWIDRCLGCGSAQWNSYRHEGGHTYWTPRKCCGRIEVIDFNVAETEAATILAELAAEPAIPPASRYLEAYHFARNHTGSGRVLAQLLLNLYNSGNYPLTTTYGLHGTLDRKCRKLALDCVIRYAWHGENDEELLEIGRKLASDWPELHRDQLL